MCCFRLKVEQQQHDYGEEPALKSCSKVEVPRLSMLIKAMAGSSTVPYIRVTAHAFPDLHIGKRDVGPLRKG